MIRLLSATALVAVVVLCGRPAAAQEHQHNAMSAPASSMASLANYSAEERAQGLREGRGMGLAIPAEGNGYPGPRHVLELADQLGITADQRQKTEALFNAMKSDAQRLGAQLLAEEADLDAMFRDQRATPALLEETARRIGTTEAALKVTHLKTHLAMMQIVRPDQVAKYVALRRAGGGTGNTRPGEPAAEGHKH